MSKAETIYLKDYKAPKFPRSHGLRGNADEVKADRKYTLPRWSMGAR